MLILLPPSEGKTRPDAGPPLDLEQLVLPALNPTRQRVLDALVRVCSGNRKRAMDRLGLGPTQTEAIERNAVLPTEPTARADAVYTGVLFAAWDPATASAETRRRADECVLVASALFGLVRPGDTIPAYRLSAGVTLPRLGTTQAIWRDRLGPALAELTAGDLLVDLRSGAYVALHPPKGDLAARTVTVRVLQERDGKRTVVSHFNKATKGRIVRHLLEEGADPRDVAGLHSVLRDLGWVVERDGNRLDVVVRDV